MKSNLTRRKDGSYALKHKTKKGKKGDCVECGQNEVKRELGLLYRHVANDMNLVREYIEQHLTEYKKHKSVTPSVCFGSYGHIKHPRPQQVPLLIRYSLDSIT